MSDRRPVVSVRSVSVRYPARATRALEDVSVDIPPASLTGLTGPSGCGKSTLARCMAGWQKPSAGEIAKHGEVQLVMQDPGSSLNPRFTAFEVVEEPLRIANRLPGARRRTDELLQRVGIVGSDSKKTSGRFSGGERARLAIARALAAMSEETGGLLILDESLSALDFETRTRILALLHELRTERDLAVLLISHDRELLAGVAENSITMEAGRIV